MTFNEDTRVKIPAILTLTRLGYDYISLKGRDDIDQETNIFKDIFFKNIRKLNPSVEETNIQKFFQKIQLMLDNDDLGKEFYQNLIKPTDIKFIDWEHIENNQLNVCTELTYGNKDEDNFRPDITLLINGIPLAFIEVKKPNNREGMVLNSQSTSVDIMRWDFSVMGAKAYVLQLSENVRRSNEQKNKNGEITGLAPLGYENYIDERGKHFVRQKEPDATIIRKCYEMYSLGRASVAEIQHYANMMGLRTRKGAPISVNTMHFILENPFYYGEMKTKRGLMPHIYKPLVNKELWDMCQAQKAIRAGQFLRTSDKNLLYRGLIICGVTNRQCPCELKKDVFSYVACWRKDKTRIYIREEEFTKQIRSILNRIKLPDCIVIELQKELKTAKASERKFCTEEIARLKTEQTRLKQKMDVLFDMRLDGELDRETFDLKRNELQVKITRLNNKIVAHEKADNSFDETILGLLDIATQAGYIFEKSSNVDLKRLLLKFVFENITLTEGQISYKLRFPFNEFANLTTPKKNKPTSYEPTPNLINLSVRANNNQNVQSGYMNFCEPRFTDKNQGVTSKNATPLQSGWGGWIRTNE